MTKRPTELETKTQGLELIHDELSRNTRMQLKQVFEAMRELMTPPEPPTGFVTNRMSVWMGRVVAALDQSEPVPFLQIYL